MSISSIGLGCVTFGREIDQAAAFAILDHALAAGITLLDTAANYGGGASERVLGEWLNGRGVRDRVVLATKVASPLTAKAMAASIEASLRRLRTERVDLLLLHQFDEDTPLEETLAALDTAVRRGQARCVGCSNFSAGQLARSVDLQRRRGQAVMAAVQPMYNLVHRQIEADLLPACAAMGVGVITYSPLGAGFLTGKYRPDQPAPAGSRFDIKPGHRRHYFSQRGFEVVERLRAASARLGVPMARLAIAWVLRRPGIASVLVGARHVEHVDQALAADALAGELGDRLDEELGR